MQTFPITKASYDKLGLRVNPTSAINPKLDKFITIEVGELFLANILLKYIDDNVLRQIQLYLYEKALINFEVYEVGLDFEEQRILCLVRYTTPN